MDLDSIKTPLERRQKFMKKSNMPTYLLCWNEPSVISLTLVQLQSPRFTEQENEAQGVKVTDSPTVDSKDYQRNHGNSEIQHNITRIPQPAVGYEA